MRHPSRAGVTMVELLVVLLIMSLLAGVSTAALGSLRRPKLSQSVQRIADARRTALATGHASTITLPTDSTPLVIRLLPDGGAIGPAGESLDGPPAPDSL